MKTKQSLFILASILFLFTLVIPRPVLAHGDEPRLEISADRLNPGSVLDIRGVDFEFEEEVILALIGTQSEIPLGSVTADTDGVFLLTITLPVDLPEGTYVIRGTTDDHTVDSPQLTIWGSAQMEGGGQGVRDEDDGLLAPMPTFAPAVPTQELKVEASMDTETPSNQSTPIVWVVAGIGLILLVSLAIWIKKTS